MSFRETRLFIPATPPFADGDPWPNIFGHVVRPLTRLPGLTSFWFSRYVLPLTDRDHADCDPYGFPLEFYREIDMDSGPSERGLLSVRFRYQLPREKIAAFEKSARALVERRGLRALYWRGYSILGNLGGPRFTVIESRRRRRSRVVWEMAHSASVLMLDALEGPDARGDFHLEPLAARVPHHLVSNITGRPG